MAKMRTLHSTHKNQGFAPQTPQSDESDENGGCHTHTQNTISEMHRFHNLELWLELKYSSYEISHEKCSEMFSTCLGLCFCGSGKITQNFRQISCKISLQKNQENSPMSFCRCTGRMKYRKTPHDHKNMIGTSNGLSKKPQTRPPPPKRRNFMGMGVFQQNQKMPGTHKIGAAIPAPELRAEKLLTSGFS